MNTAGVFSDFTWLCPECGEENFVSPVSAAEDVSLPILTVPETVLCSNCVMEVALVLKTKRPRVDGR